MNAPRSHIGHVCSPSAHTQTQALARERDRADCRSVGALELAMMRGAHAGEPPAAHVPRWTCALHLASPLARRMG